MMTTNKETKKFFEYIEVDSSLTETDISAPILNGIRPTAISVDLTNECNLKCLHCFWDSNNKYPDKKINPNIIDYVKKALKRFPTISNILWFGGEPLINKESISLLEKGLCLRKNNIIVTNGTFPLPNFKNKNLHYGVGIDGTEKISNYIKRADCYKKVKNNMRSAIKKDIPVNIGYCITSLNIQCIPEFLKEWADEGLSGIFFTLYTRIKGRNQRINLSYQDRCNITFLLQEMKEKYPDLIINSRKMIELFHPKYDKDLADKCPMNIFKKDNHNIYCIHLCNNGKVRLPCALGKDTAHEECRSIGKMALIAGKVFKDKESYLSLLMLFNSKYNKNKEFRKEFAKKIMERKIKA
ncbi:MAG: radical SAM protein [Deltaproteobacteria bacterium]|nr:radical SAM protein [Deltaproteobacteria bacterium]